MGHPDCLDSGSCFAFDPFHFGVEHAVKTLAADGASGGTVSAHGVAEWVR
jgi:hypothetical protein